MDDLKVIEKLHEMFGKKYGDKEYSPQERSEQYVTLRKLAEKWFDWYEKHQGKSTGENPQTMQKIYEPLPNTTGVAEFKDTEGDWLPILQDFNRRGCDVNHVRDHIESFVDKVKEGWASKIRKINES